MSDAIFEYQVGGRAGGRRPGAHAGRAGGAGNEFLVHARLFDHPDPRRLDLRASLRAGGDAWLVRTHRQRTAIPVHAAVDVSASMACGSPAKLALAAAFVASMADSAFKHGDAAGLCGFDNSARDDLYRPAQHSRTASQAMAQLIRNAGPARGPGCGVLDALQPLVARQALVFLVSDFHWPLARIGAALDLLSAAWVVPLVIWDASETSPPAANAFVRLRDAESGSLRSLWLTPALRRQWQASIDARRNQLDTLFASRNLRPLHLSGRYDATAVSHYFIEGQGT